MIQLMKDARRRNFYHNNRVYNNSSQMRRNIDFQHKGETDDMEVLLSIVGLLIVIVSLIVILIAVFRKKPFKDAIIALIFGMIVLVVATLLDANFEPPEEPEANQSVLSVM